MAIVKALVALIAVALAGASLVPDPAGAHADDAAPGTSDLVSGWQIASSARVRSPGQVISDPGYAAAGWRPISRPETLMAGLVENGRYPGIFYSNRLARVPTRQFAVPWWYRDSFRRCYCPPLPENFQPLCWWWPWRWH